MTDEQYKEAAEFWDRKDAESVKMLPEKIRAAAEAFLSAHKVCALAVGGGDTIRCTPLEYTWHDGAVWIFSEGGKKFAGLRASKAVALSVFETNAEFGHLHSLQMNGTASVIADSEDPSYIAEAGFRKIPMEALRKLKEPMYLIRIEPGEVTMLNSDFRNEGCGNRQTVSWNE